MKPLSSLTSRKAKMSGRLCLPPNQRIRYSPRRARLQLSRRCPREALDQVRRATGSSACSNRPVGGLITARGGHGERSYQLNNTGFFQRGVSAVLIDCLQPARGDPNAHELFQLRNPNAMLVQVRTKKTRHIFGNVPANAAFFLGHTAAVNHAAASGSRSCDAADF